MISKGKWAGMPMFQMSLQERASCPSTCKQWAACFGNNMAFAHRIDHTHPEFMPKLAAEIERLAPGVEELDPVVARCGELVDDEPLRAPAGAGFRAAPTLLRGTSSTASTCSAPK